jgi:hypothetical protein
MDQAAPRSLKHEYDLFVENEIEAYKESITRTALLKIGDEAVASLQSGMQFGMNELLLVHEVDKIIRKRQRIPSYATWRRKSSSGGRSSRSFCVPSIGGLSPDSPVAREIHPSPESRVLIAGAEPSTALYLAANGCSVTTIDAHAPSEPSATDSPELANLPGRIDHHSKG